MSFPDISDSLIAWIEATTEATADTVTPDAFDGGLFVRVDALGSPSDGVTRFHRVELHHFAPTRAAAVALAEQIHDTLTPRTRAGAAIIDTVRIDAAPHEIPWPGDNVRRIVARYQISTRR